MRHHQIHDEPSARQMRTGACTSVMVMCRP
jgi:hypothetical protein